MEKQRAEDVTKRTSERLKGRGAPMLEAQRLAKAKSLEQQVNAGETPPEVEDQKLRTPKRSDGKSPSISSSRLSTSPIRSPGSSARSGSISDLNFGPRSPEKTRHSPGATLKKGEEAHESPAPRSTQEPIEEMIWWAAVQSVEKELGVARIDMTREMLETKWLQTLRVMLPKWSNEDTEAIIGELLSETNRSTFTSVFPTPLSPSKTQAVIEERRRKEEEPRGEGGGGGEGGKKFRKSKAVYPKQKVGEALAKFSISKRDSKPAARKAGVWREEVQSSPREAELDKLAANWSVSGKNLWRRAEESDSSDSDDSGFRVEQSVSSRLRSDSASSVSLEIENRRRLVKQDRRLQDQHNMAKLVSPDKATSEELMKILTGWVLRDYGSGKTIFPAVSGNKMNESWKRMALEPLSGVREVRKKYGLTCAWTTALVRKMLAVQGGWKLHWLRTLNETEEARLKWNFLLTLELEDVDELPSEQLLEAADWKLKDQLEAARNMEVVLYLMFGDRVREKFKLFVDFLYQECWEETVLANNRFVYYLERAIEKFIRLGEKKAYELKQLAASNGKQLSVLTEYMDMALRELVAAENWEHVEDTVWGDAAMKEILRNAGEELNLTKTRGFWNMAEKISSGEGFGKLEKTEPNHGERQQQSRRQVGDAITCIPAELRSEVLKVLGGHCLRTLAGKECRLKNCKFDHKAPAKTLVATSEAKLAVLHLDDSLTEAEKSKEKVRLVGELTEEKNKREKKDLRAAGGRLIVQGPLDVMLAIQRDGSGLEKENKLRREFEFLETGKKRLEKGVLPTWRPYPGLSLEENESMIMMREVNAELEAAYPCIHDVTKASRSLLVARAVAVKKEGETSVAVWFSEGIKSLMTSSMPGSVVAAKFLRAKTGKSAREASCLVSGRDAVWHPEHSPGHSCLTLFGEPFLVRDHGDEIVSEQGVLANQCVIVVLASVLGVESSNLHRSLSSLFKAKVEKFAGDEYISEEQLKLMRCDHDMRHQVSHDLRLVLQAAELFSFIRIIVVSIRPMESLGVNKVTVLKSSGWNQDSGRTVLVATCQGHALTLTWEGRQLNNEPHGAISNAEADALLHRWKMKGCELIILEGLDHQEFVEKPKAITVQSLKKCGCGCEEPLLYYGDLNASGCLPRGIGPAVSATLAKDYINNTYSIENVSLLASQRCEDYKRYATMTQSDLKSMDVTLEEEQAVVQYLDMARAALGTLDKEALKRNDAEAVVKAGEANAMLAEKGDEVITIAKSSRRAMALLRREVMRRDGSYPTSPEGIDSLSEFLTVVERKVMMQFCDVGALFGQIFPVGGQQKPHEVELAIEVRGETWYSAVLDVARGGALLFTAVSLPYVSEGVWHKTIIVEKKDAAGKVSGYRTVVDMSKYTREVASQHEWEELVPGQFDFPRMNVGQVKDWIKAVFHLSRLYPGIPLLCALVDVDTAFKRPMLNGGDVNSTGITLPHLDPDKKLLMLLGSLPMGQGSSPANFDRFSSLGKAVLTRVGLPTGKDGDLLAAFAVIVDHVVDDTALLFPDMGSGPEYVVAVAKSVMKALLGEDSWNEVKNGPNALATLIQKQWGYIFNFTDVAKFGFVGLSVTVPKDKVDRLLTKVRLLASKLGQKRITLKEVSAVAGLANWMSVACVGLKDLQPHFYRLLSSVDEVFVELFGPEWLQECRWDSFAWAVHQTILLMLSYKNSSSEATRSAVRALDPEEIEELGLRTYWIAFDASGGEEGQWGGVNHTNGGYDAGLLQPLADRLNRVVAEEDRAVGFEGETAIAVGEMIAFMVTFFSLLDTLDEDCKEMRVVKAVTDNQVVWYSVMKGGSKHRQLQWMISVVSRLCIKYDLVLLMFWTSTHHNDIADISSRHDLLDKDGLQAALDEVMPGLHRLETRSFANFLEAAAIDPMHLWRLEGEEGNLELEAELCRYALQKEQLLMVRGESRKDQTFSVLDVYGGVPTTRVVLNDMGLETVEMIGVGHLLEKLILGESSLFNGKEVVVHRSFETYLKDRVHEVDCMLLHCLPPSLMNDSGRVLGLIGKVIVAAKPSIVVMVLMPSHWELMKDDLLAMMLGVGFQLLPTDGELITSKIEGNMVCVQYKKRYILHFEKKLSNLPDLVGPLGGWKSATQDILKRPEHEEGRVLGEYRVQVKRNEPGKPKVVGMIKPKGSGDDAEKGWEVKVKGREKLLDVIQVSRRKIMVLGKTEVRSKGIWIARHAVEASWGPSITVTDLSGPCMPIAGRDGQRVIVWETRGATPYCRQLTIREIGLVHAEGDKRVQCLLEKTADLGLSYLLSHTSPIPLMMATGARLASRLPLLQKQAGREEMGDASKVELEEDDLRCSGGSYRPTTEELDELSIKLMRGGLSKGTNRAYESSCKHWFKFCSLYEVPVLLEGTGLKVERVLMRLLAWLRFGQDRELAASTIAGIRSAIGWWHRVNGMENPFDGCERVGLMIRQMKKQDGKHRTQKLPVDVRMLSNIIKRLDLKQWDELIIAVALMLGFVFLLRSGEMLCQGGSKVSEHILKANQVRFLRRGVLVKGRVALEADEFMLVIASSKVDQTSHGVTLSSVISSHPLCPGRLILRMMKMRPEFFSDNNVGCLLTKRNGKGLHRGVISKLLKKEGKRMGRKKLDFGVHSLRIGGTTKMWAEGYSAEDIKTRGRWKSDCWRRYVWGGQDRGGDITKNLLKKGAVALVMHV